MKNYQKLQIWQRGPDLTISLFRATRLLPKEELCALTNQMRRAWVSIPANIAEGCGRDGDAELKRFLTIAMGSACELDYYLLLSRELGYLPETAARPLSAEVMEIRRMLGSFIRRLKA